MPKILLDFDYTLFDVEKFKDALYKAMRPYMENKSRKFWQEEKRKIQSKKKGYDPKKHIALIIPDKKDRKKAEKAVEKTIKTAKKYLYKDTDWFFKKYKDYDLHIITFGFDKFQKEKIKATGLDPNIRIGFLNDDQIRIIRDARENIEDQMVPNWMLNRQKDLETGRDLHKIGPNLILTEKNDVDSMRKMKSWKGIRHNLGLKVRGQRTKTTGRTGRSVGVRRKRLLERRNEISKA